MDWWGYIGESTLLGILGAVSLVFGVMVLFHSNRSTSSRWFFAAISSNGLWALGLSVFLIISPNSSDKVLPVMQFYYVAAAIIAVSMLGLVISMVGRRIQNAQLLLMLLPTLILSVTIILLPELFIRSVTYIDGGSVVDLSYGYISYAIYFVAYYMATISILIIYLMKEKTKVRKLQMTSLLMAYGVAGVLGIIFNLLLPWLGNYSLVWIGPTGTIAFITIIYKSIATQGLFDVRTALSRTIAYVLTLIILAVVYVSVAYFVSAMFLQGKGTYTGMHPLGISLSLLLVLIFQPVKRFFDKLTNHIFYRGEYDRGEFFRGFGRILSYDTNLKLLLRQASKYISDNLGASQVYFYIANRGTYYGTRKSGASIPRADIDRISRYCEENYEISETIVTNLVQSKDVKKILSSYSAYITLPLILQGEIIGYLFVGEHKSREYNMRDVEILESIANELTIAVQNSLSVEEIRDLNETLQHRIDDATKELRSSNKQLQRLDEAKDEFISMASHQLRTPLTSIKGYLDMVLQGDLGKVSATQRAVLSEAFLSSERMVSLINDFLNVSRLQTGKFIIERRESDLAAAVCEQVQMLDILAKQRDLELTKRIAKDVPPMDIDIDKFRQVVLNMIDNAIYYSRPGTSVKIALKKDGSDVIFTVKDTGIGVPKSEQAGLFGKFFRASNARKKRPDGTGVGLFLARKVILAHGGSVIFESTEDKGSTFGFKIPIVYPKKD